MREQLRATIVLLAALTLLTGLAYPLAVTGLAQLLFPAQANGSLIVRDGALTGSALIGQPFADPAYFWGRPSAAGGAPYNAGAGGGRNWSPGNPALRAAVARRVQELRAADPAAADPLPVDLLTASGSGLDPHLSPAAAACQVHRVAQARGLPEQQLRLHVAQATEPRQWGFLGEPRVNVLKLNLSLGRPDPRNPNQTRR